MKYLVIVAGLLILGSCAHMQEKWINTFCNYDGAYSLGYSEQQKRKEMNVRPFSTCPISIQTAALKGYREGYEKGVADDQKANSNQSGNSISMCFGGSCASVNSKNNSKYFCKTEAFMDKYEAFGPTKLEARQNVMRKCTKKHAQMHCDDLACKRNI